MGVRGTGFRHMSGRPAKAWLCGGLLLALLVLVPTGAQAALSSVADNDWVTNGPVYAMARSGNTIYLGGNFSQIGPRTGPAVTFSGGSSTPDATFPQVSGAEAWIRAVVSDGAGGWYVGGNFTHVGGVARAGLAHVLSGGTVDPNFAPSLDVAHGSSAAALALSGSTLYVGGNFATVSGTSRDGLAALNTSDGSLQSWNPGPTSGPSGVETLAVAGGVLYVGGTFTEMGGQPRASLAAFTTSTGSLTSWAPQATGTTPTVKVLAVSGSSVYLAGYFDHVAGEPRTGFAAVDTSGTLASWNPEASGCAAAGQTLAVAASVVYVGGCFTHIGGQSRDSVAALDTTTGSATSWNPAPTPVIAGVATAIAVSGSTVYVAGNFTEIGGQSRNGLAALDTTTAKATSWNPNLNTPGVYTLATGGSQVFVGGTFSSAGGMARSDLAAIDATTGEATSWNPGVAPVFKIANEPIRAISVAGGVVYVGGSFSSVGGQPRANLAALDPTTGTATSWNPGASSPSSENSVVAALLATASTIYVGGSFTTLGGSARSDLGAVSAATGIATSWNPQLAAPKATSEHGVAAVDALALSGTTLYVGGGFSGLEGNSRTGAGAVSTETGSATSWNPAVKPIAEAPYVAGLVVSGSAIYLAGVKAGLLAVDASSGAALPWYPLVRNEGGSIFAVAAANGGVYLGAAGLSGGSDVVALDSAGGLPLAWAPKPSGLFGRAVTAIMTFGNHVYLGGVFTTTDATAASGFAAYTITGPINTAAPTIAGTAAEGQLLTEHHGSWTATPTSYASQWLRCPHTFPGPCTSIGGATSQTYALTSADVNATIEVQETATNAEGSSDPVGSLATAVILGPPENLTPPSITGTPSVGQTLTCLPGTWSNSPTSYSYVWRRDFEPFPGATAATYTVTSSDVGHDLTCEVTASNAAGGHQATADAGVIPPSGGGHGPGSGTGGSPGGGAPGPGTGGSTGGSGTPTGGGAQTSQSGPSPSAVIAALTAVVSGPAPPRITSLLHHGGYSLAFSAPGAGTLSLRWTVAKAHGAGLARTVVVASGTRSFAAAERGSIKLRLSAAGRKLLRRQRSLRVREEATFTPSGGATQTKHATLTIRPGKHH
jgi:hypothetical protein